MVEIYWQNLALVHKRDLRQICSPPLPPCLNEKEMINLRYNFLKK